MSPLALRLGYRNYTTVIPTPQGATVAAATPICIRLSEAERARAEQLAERVTEGNVSELLRRALDVYAGDLEDTDPDAMLARAADTLERLRSLTATMNGKSP